MGILSRLFGEPKYMKEMKAGKKVVVVVGAFNDGTVKAIVEFATVHGYDLTHTSQSRNPNPFSGQFLTQYTMVFTKRA